MQMRELQSVREREREREQDFKVGETAKRICEEEREEGY